MALTARPIGDPGFGVRIRGVSCERLDDDAARQFLREALAESGLVVLEDVDPSHRLQSLVGEVFGTLKGYRSEQTPGAAAPEPHVVTEMVTGPQNCTIVEIGGERLSGWMPWHFDQPYNPHPNPARVLRCGQSVPSGGLTGFLDGAELYRQIDPDLRAQIEQCSVRYTLNMAFKDFRFGVPADFRLVRQANGEGSNVSDDDLPNATHPAVRTSPTGHKVLHVSQWMTTGIAGRHDDGGDALLDAVAHEIVRLSASLAYFHRWRPSDILVWDNLRMLHASSGFDPAQTRIMYRTTVHGR
jgi:taurine dioxygenase